MTRISVAFASLALVLACAPTQASLTSSAVSDSIGASSAGFSGSLATSSNRSSTRDVAQGNYRIEAIATADGRPDHLRVTLQRELPAGEAAGAHDTLQLTLPLAAFGTSGLGLGQRVAATQRAYGIEFARADDRQPFFLVLEDHWLQELAARPVQL